MKRFYKSLILFLPLALVLTSCNTDDLGNDLSNQIEAKLFPNIWAFLVQFIAFIIVALLVIKLGYKPVRKYLDKRRELLDNEVNEAKKLNADAKENFLKSEKALADTKKGATSIIEDAKKEANAKKEEILNEAFFEASKTKEKALLDIEKTKESVKKKLQDEIINVALDASSKILKREVNEKDNKRIINQFVDDLENDKKE